MKDKAFVLSSDKVSDFFNNDSFTSNDALLRCLNKRKDFENLHIGDEIEFDNTLIRNTGVIIKVAVKDAYFKANGERTRYILNVKGGYTTIVSSSEVLRVIKKA